MHQLNFPLLYHFTRTKDGITIPVSLGQGTLIAQTVAKIDTGAEYCLFRREIGEALELEIESGLPKNFATLTGTIEAFGHQVTLQSFEFTFQSFVYFAKEYQLLRNLLGSVGWLRNFKLGLVDYDELLYLAPYDS
jgi:hypothetical protein